MEAQHIDRLGVFLGQLEDFSELLDHRIGDLFAEVPLTNEEIALLVATCNDFNTSVDLVQAMYDRWEAHSRPRYGAGDVLEPAPTS